MSVHILKRKTIPGEGGNDPVPRVSVIVPVLNEAPHIARCLDGLLAQDYPAHALEILVVDGGSDDGTLDIVRAYARRTSQVHLLRNPARNAAVALNVGLHQSQGDIVIRVDGHTFVAPDYVRQCVYYLLSSDADAVGGVLRPIGDTPTGEVIAAVMAHPLGGGPAPFRHARHPMWVDTVYLGAWRRETLLSLGGFDPRLEANEDYELFYRLRRAGGRILCHPDIRSQTVVRATFAALWRQYLRYGRGKAHMLCIHPWSLRLRQLPAPALVASVVFLGGLGIFWPSALWGVAGVLFLYALVTGIVAGVLARRLGWRRWGRIWWTFWVMHWGWGIGFWWGWISCRRIPT